MSQNLPQKRLLKPGSTQHAIHFTGCGFMLPSHFGVVAALIDQDIKFEHATATSGGVMAALAVLGAAELNLGVRQCFDLRYEWATSVGSVRSFFAYYRQYFRCFRSASAQKVMGIEQLKGRLTVRLGRFEMKRGPHCVAVSDFASEQDLEDAFMSAAYIPFGTSVLPPFFRGQFCVDAGLCDALTGAFQTNFDDTIWPPCPYDQVADPVGPPTGLKVLVVTHKAIADRLDEESFDGIIIKGKARVIRDFWADWEAMKGGFIDGYLTTLSHIDTRRVKVPTQQEIERKFETIMRAEASWKQARSFDKPQLFFDFDPIAIFAVLALLLALLVAFLSGQLQTPLVGLAV